MLGPGRKVSQMSLVPNGSQEPDRLDARAVRFWGSPTLALIAEEPPGTALFEAIRDFAIGSSRHPLVSAAYGVPDCYAAREQAGLSREEAAARLNVGVSVVYALELCWKPLPFASALVLCERYGVPFGALFHDRDFDHQPMWYAWRRFYRDDMGQVEL